MMEKFTDLALSPASIEALAALNIDTCTPVQASAIPAMLDWQDVLVQAPTGTGKTFAFGLPIIEHLEPHEKELKAIILAPTRELAQQIGVELTHLLATRPDYRLAVLYGGENMKRQLDQLKQKPQIVVATPGRFLDHLNRRSLRLDAVDTLVLDEADRMLDMGFIKDVRRILDRLKKVRQLAFFSATFSRSLLDISWLYQQNVLELKLANEEGEQAQIRQYYVSANGPERVEAINDILADPELKQALVFVNMKQSADMVARKLSQKGLEAAAIQGDMSQSARDKVMKRFRAGQLRILVATDVAARGLDIEAVDVVFNYDLPLENENYIHRIGRTGRAGRQGLAFSFVNEVQEKRLQELLRKCRCEAEPYAWQAAKADRTAPVALSEEAEAAAVARIKAAAAKRAGKADGPKRQGRTRQNSQRRRPERRNG